MSHSKPVHLAQIYCRRVLSTLRGRLQVQTKFTVETNKYLFYVHGTLHHLSVLNKTTRRSWVVTYISLLDYSTCFGRFLHPSSGVQQLYMQPLARVSHLKTTFLRGRFITRHVGWWLSDVKIVPGAAYTVVFLMMGARNARNI